MVFSGMRQQYVSKISDVSAKSLTLMILTCQATDRKKWEFSHFNLTALLNVGISAFVTQKSITMLADCKNTMNHGGCHCTMAAIVPHPRLQGVETLANVLCNKAT
jgi:hypothetical protein